MLNYNLLNILFTGFFGFYQYFKNVLMHLIYLSFLYDCCKWRLHVCFLAAQTVKITQKLY